MRQGPPVCLHNKPIEGPCRLCEFEFAIGSHCVCCEQYFRSDHERMDHECPGGGCNAGTPCPHPNLQPLKVKA